MKIGIDTKHRAARLVKDRQEDVAPLAKRVGVSQSTLWNFLYGKTINFGKLPHLAFELGVSLDWLLTGDGMQNPRTKFDEKSPKGGGYADNQRQNEIDLPTKVVDRDFPFGPDTVPILGQANASSKAIMLNFDDPIGEFPRHPNQKNVKNAYYVRIYDESMEPRYYPRELAAVNGNMSPLSKEDCVIQLKNGEVYIKRFIKTTSKEVICAQLNPAKEWKCLLADTKAIHAVVGRG